MTKRMIIMLILVGVLFALIIGFNQFKANMIKKALAGNAAPPATVSTMKAPVSTWQPALTAIGTLRAVRGIDVATEVAGMVEDVKFQSGDRVEAGQVLIQLNAEADKAQLESLQAEAELAQLTYERDKKQFAKKAVSESTVDADLASLKSKRAQVAQEMALIDKKTIKAPFAGRLGISTINEGRYLGAGESFVTLQRLDPIYVDFWVPQNELAKVRVGREVTVTIDAYGDQKFTGKVTAINPQVDNSTRNIRIEASLPNAERELLPGMFAHVNVSVGDAVEFLTLPQTAITYNPYGSSVYLAVPAEGGGMPVAKQVFVTTGMTRGDQVAVLSGIKAGDVVVTSGQLKLRNGTQLIIDNSVQPTNNPSPTPREGQEQAARSAVDERAGAGAAASASAGAIAPVPAAG